MFPFTVVFLSLSLLSGDALQFESVLMCVVCLLSSHGLRVRINLSSPQQLALTLGGKPSMSV